MNIAIINKNYKINKDDPKISWALMSSFIILTLQYLFLVYFNLLETAIGAHMQLLSKSLVGAVYLYAIPVVLRRSKRIFFESYVVAVFIFVLHYIFFPENRIFIATLIIPFFFMVLPSFIYALSLRDLLIFKNIMEKTSCIVFWTGALLGTLVFFTKASIGSYSMSLSYYMLLPAVVSLNKLFRKRTVIDSIIFILSLAIIISLGSRGPILCIVVFILLKILRPNFRTSYKKTIIFLNFLGISAVVLIFFKEIIKAMYNALLGYGIHSRTLYLFLMDSGFYLSSRSSKYQIVIEEIIKSPILGIGLAGDRRAANGIYVHNLFIELISDFGLIIGIFLCIFILYFILKLLLIKDKNKRDIFIIWVSLGFVPLMMSGSYLTNINFAIFMGLLININKYNKKLNAYNY